jgi:hypothetical protein
MAVHACNLSTHETDDGEFENNLGNILTPCLRKKKGKEKEKRVV